MSIWLETPLLYSTHISALQGANVYLKLDNLQPSQSFKYRGISNFIDHALRTRGPSTHFIIASSGNAGLAAASASKVLKARCTIFMPLSVGERTLNFAKREGAEVFEVDGGYSDAVKLAQEAFEKETNAVMIPAFDDPTIWEGHSSMTKEIVKQLPNKPDGIFCSVGGGGLLGGVILGCKKVGWDDVPVIALEPHGSNCFYHTICMNTLPNYILPDGIQIIHDATTNMRLAHIDTNTSRASSLAATHTSSPIVKMVLERKGGVKCVCVPDEMSMQAAESFAEDHKFLIELACATTISAAYKPALISHLFPNATKPLTLVFIVDGGFKISLAEMEEYRKIVQEDVGNGGGEWEVLCNGERWTVPK
ncbi:hypothetical protein JAAARDRAFT_56487 [Jaapia argillacea MUCL 33604]|uniref:L-serine ammonia-lyase n=1 Tax=Jaapia argillacea MUCL 33604 TaxID=933084 RepID=A0A067Q7L5_9AGAM|nr:hypothetical protein JAAARDRAFT_56487 [Jaapia argillacea MUCL 33604]